MVFLSKLDRKHALLKKVFLCLTLLFTALIANAANNPPGVNVLNTQYGLPPPKVAMVLEQMQSGAWVK